MVEKVNNKISNIKISNTTKLKKITREMKAYKTTKNNAKKLISMPNSETSESKSKQPTGSSKRKRKHSIKRNIVVDDDSDCSESTKPSRVERTYGKRAKGDKNKSGKDTEEIKKGNKPISDLTKSGQIKIEEEFIKDDESLDEKCKNLKNTESATGQCTSSKQCLNCKYCSKHNETKEEMNDSKEKQTKSKKKFACEICAKDGCTKVYTSIEKHKHHLARAHEIYSEEFKKFECTDCPETVWFPTKSKFVYHLGTKHPGLMKFICEICAETFIMKANYRSHMKSHNLVVEKKFTCDVCNGSFVNKAGFEAHKKRFPGPHIKQSCVHCGFSFSKEKLMKNHRCKTLLLEEAAAKASKAQEVQESLITEESEDPLKLPADSELKMSDGTQIYIEKKPDETSTETDLLSKKLINEEDPSGNKRVIFHRVVPRRNQEQAVYRPVQMQAQNVPEPVVVQEVREIDLEGGTFITAATNEPEQQFIVRDLNGHLLQGNQILQLDINDVQPGEENQVYLADWNIVAPYVIREKSP